MSKSKPKATRHPVTRRANVLTVRCADVEDALGIEALLKDLFSAAAKVDLAVEAVATCNPKMFHPQAMMAEIVPVDDAADGHA